MFLKERFRNIVYSTEYKKKQSAICHLEESQCIKGRGTTLCWMALHQELSFKDSWNYHLNKEWLPETFVKHYKKVIYSQMPLQYFSEWRISLLFILYKSNNWNWPSHSGNVCLGQTNSNSTQVLKILEEIDTLCARQKSNKMMIWGCTISPGKAHTHLCDGSINAGKNTFKVFESAITEGRM